jgi:hypothetical protein
MVVLGKGAVSSERGTVIRWTPLDVPQRRPNRDRAVEHRQQRPCGSSRVLRILPTYLPSYLATYLATYVAIYLSTYLTTYLPTHLPTYGRDRAAERRQQRRCVENAEAGPASLGIQPRVKSLRSSYTGLYLQSSYTRLHSQSKHRRMAVHSRRCTPAPSRQGSRSRTPPAAFLWEFQDAENAEVGPS